MALAGVRVNSWVAESAQPATTRKIGKTIRHHFIAHPPTFMRPLTHPLSSRFDVWCRPQLVWRAEAAVVVDGVVEGGPGEEGAFDADGEPADAVELLKVAEALCVFFRQHIATHHGFE